MKALHLRRFALGLSGLGTLVAFWMLLAAALGAQGSDHNDPPFIHGRLAVDVTDLYAFRSPENDRNLVLAMALNPGWRPPQPFWPEALYQFHVDSTGDLVPDTVLSVSFGPPQLGVPQEITVRGLGAPMAGRWSVPAVGARPGPPEVFGRDGIKVFVGPRDDPFFNDLIGRTRFLAAPFPPVPGNGLRPADQRPVQAAGSNVLAIVVELPVTALTGAATSETGTIRLWATSSLTPVERVVENPNLVNQWNRWAAEREAKNADPNDWAAFREHVTRIRAPDPGGSPLTFTQVDRSAAPLTFGFLPGPRRNELNRDIPANDARFQGAAVPFIRDVRERVRPFLPPEDQAGVPAEVLANMLFPDVLTLDLSQPVQFPNGRRPADDIGDLILGLQLNRGSVLAGGPGVSDGIDTNDVAFLETFPYLAPPH